jgi:hypothetical protein
MVRHIGRAQIGEPSYRQPAERGAKVCNSEVIGDEEKLRL